jgi:branched-chain amino acid transport system substrate-binding protein
VTSKPINVYFLNSQGSSTSVSAPEGTWAAQAATDYINTDLGGVNGRKIKLETCFLDQTPATETKCANQAVSAKPDVIVYGNGSLDNIDSTIAAKAGIPFTAYYSASAPTQKSDSAFVYSDDIIGPTLSAAVLAKQKGLKSLSVIGLNFPIVTNSWIAAKPTVEKLGLDFRTSAVNYGVADQSPQWEAVTSHNPGAILIEEDTADCVASAKAKASLGFSGMFMMASTCDTAAVQKAGGSALNGTIFIADDSSTDAGSADVQTYTTAIDKYSPQIKSNGLELAVTTTNQFQVIMNLYAVLKTVQDPNTIDASTITSAFKAAKDLPVFMGGGSSFTCDGNQVPNLPALCSLVQTYGSYQNGKTTYVGSLSADIIKALQS